MRTKEVTALWEFIRDYNRSFFKEPIRTRLHEIDERLASIEAENTRLRSCLEDAAENERLTTHEFNQLEEERDKLRELVRDMWEGYNDPRCEECHLKDTPTCADCPICAREASVIDRMRELGVEVDHD